MSTGYYNKSFQNTGGKAKTSPSGKNGNVSRSGAINETFQFGKYGEVKARYGGEPGSMFRGGPMSSVERATYDVATSMPKGQMDSPTILYFYHD